MKTVKQSWSRVANHRNFRGNYDAIFRIELDLSRVCDVEIEGIDPKDHPDYCDAYISSALYKELDGDTGPNSMETHSVSYRDLTDKELDWLNEQRDYVYEKVMESII